MSGIFAFGKNAILSTILYDVTENEMNYYNIHIAEAYA
jgi:hypothetical protein